MNSRIFYRLWLFQSNVFITGERRGQAIPDALKAHGTGGSCLSWIFWEHEILSGLSVIQLTYIKLYKEKEKKIWQEIWAKWDSSLTAVWLKWDPPVYGLQKPFKMELDKLKNKQTNIIILLCLDKTSEWDNSFVLVLTSNRKARICINLARFNEALARPLHRGYTINDKFPKLTFTHYLTFTDASSGHHNLKLDKKSSYLTTYAGQFSRYRYARLSFCTSPAGDMFKRKIDEILKDLLDAFGIADNILIVGCVRDGTGLW